MEHRPSKWTGPLLTVMIFLNSVLTVTVIWLVYANVAASTRTDARHGAFCQYLLTQEAVAASHPALLPLVPGQLAALKAEGC